MGAVRAPQQEEVVTTYDVQRYTQRDIRELEFPGADDEGFDSVEFVLASDAEAHERAAVEAAGEAYHAGCICHKVNAEHHVDGVLRSVWIEGVEYQSREQAIRDCWDALQNARFMNLTDARIAVRVVEALLTEGSE